MSVATLERKIDAAKKESDVWMKKNHAWQEEVDSLLDRMNRLNGLMGNMHGLLLGLTFEIERDFSNFKKSETGNEVLRTFTQTISKILLQIHKSDLYPGVKTVYGLIKTENNYLRELAADRKIALELEADNEMAELMKKTSEAFKKI